MVFYLAGKKGWSKGDITFKIGGKNIKEISGSIALDDANPAGAKPVQIRITMDKKTVWEGTIDKGKNPVPVSIKPTATSSDLVVQIDNISETRIDFIDFVAQY
ncbi:NPCBM/NEW2 domain-containing protein [Desulfoscipio gibsoniae]|uniref:Putative carbohydrate binding protein n=1 Tax=Desulfoscipio gibsoniae DSM 7213 TaxID=767817 RepID=R4KIW5_9FIRM|nr:NPCBM/NEW2 domain-containing protein [Desulfoscipio gibsoniae]AGL00475.1 putative carbohydrate binding protein [Desulfoscipio gibsoniae DSM 7213]